MNPVVTINGCILISHPADWREKPSSKRTWQSEISGLLLGGETRQALRAVPRRQVTYLITSRTMQERVRLEARIDATTLSGFGAAPLHGRSCALSAAVNAGAQSVSITANGAWNWQAGDYAMLICNDIMFDIQPVTSTANGGLTLNFPAGLTYGWIQGALIWPVIFGKFSAEKAAPLNGALSAVKVTVAELTSNRAAQIGVVPAAPAGVGAQVIGSTNTIG